MHVAQNPQGTQAPLPPIPRMGGTPQAPGASQAPAATSAQTAREAAKVARDAARQAARDAVNEQKAVIAGQTTAGTAPPAPGFRVNGNPDIPPEVVPMMGIVFGSITAMVLLTPIIRVLTRRFDRRTEELKSGTKNLEPQLRQLQDSIDAMAIEVERISEGQRFTSKLLSERADARAVAAPKAE